MTSRFSFVLLSATVWLSLAACNNSEQTSAANNDSTSSGNDSSTAKPVASTIVTTPQAMLVVHHKVANYAKWKMSYDGHDSARLAAGIHSYVIGRDLQDSNMIQVVTKVDDTAKAMAFAKDPGLKMAMQKGGVIGTPQMNLIIMTYQDTGRIETPLRSSAMFTVKDWDEWVKNFETGKQERMDNGIVVRAYGHDARDNHKVRVVTALTDSAKAVSYFKSDMLKKRMQNSGVQGTPERFLFRVVHRY